MNNNIPPPPNTSTLPIPKPPNKVYEQNIVYIDNGESIQAPSAIELEVAVLGALLVDRTSIEEVVKILSEKVFYIHSHKLIFTAIKSLYDTGVGVDLLTVSEEMKRRGTLGSAGGDFYLIQLTQKVASSAHIEYHARIIIQKFALREFIKMSRKVMFQSLHRDPDIFDIQEELENSIAYVNTVAINPDGIQQSSITPEDELKQKYDMYLRGEVPGVPLGVDEFDEWCGGWQKRELITIGARPGMGKTTIGVAAAVNASIEKDIACAFFSLEMSKIDVMNRVAARLTSIPFSRIKRGALTKEEFDQLLEVYKFIRESKLEIHDTMEHKNVHERIIKKIRELVSKGCRLVFIDYVQLIKLARETSDRTGDLSKITRELKALANELNIPIIIFAQLNRSLDGRGGDGVPFLKDLKQSGSIEEDSDTVIFIVRPAYYKQQKSVGVELPPHIIGEVQWIVAKGRNIGVKTFKCFVDFHKFNFMSYSDMEI